MSEEQPDLFADLPGLVRHDHPDTSREAARKFTAQSGTARRRVFDALHAAGGDGMTDEELQRHLGMGGNTERPRRIELVDAGMVADSGRRRPTNSDSRGIVWTVTSRGDFWMRAHP